MYRTSEAATALRRKLTDPIYNRILRKEVGDGALDYEVYLRTRELLDLQTPADDLVVPDEMLFQIVHQAQELWLKGAAFETIALVESLDRDEPYDALGALERIVLIAQSLSDQMRILCTLSPGRFQEIRRSLGNGSGLESPGYNRLLAAAEAAWGALDRLVGRRRTTLLTIYREPEAWPDLYRLAERYIDWDGAMQSWLVEHFMLVRRTIGIDKTVRALDGFPTVALSARMTRPLFPALWHVRVEMTQSWSRDGGYAPGAARSSGCPFSSGAATADAAGTPAVIAAAVSTPSTPMVSMPVVSTPAVPPSAAAPSAVSPSAVSVSAVSMSDVAAPAGPAPAVAVSVVSVSTVSVSAVSVQTGSAPTMSPAPAPAPLERYREHFPLLAQCLYLNSNSTGATPTAARQVHEDYRRTLESWRDEVWRRWWADLAAHADDLAAFIGAPAGSVVCDTNLATLLSRVVSCFDFRRRPGIVTTDLEFPSLPFSLRAFSRYGADVTIVPSGDRISIDPEQVVRAIDERTQLVCVSHATFATGALLDLAPIVRRAREVGALVALDAYQSVGIVPIDAAALDVDFLLGGAHKWLCGSYESAFLYVRPSLIPSLEPAATGWIASADPLSFEPPTAWADSARRFASGTPAVLPTLLSRPGLAMLRAIGMDRIRAHSLAQTARIIALADEAGLPIATPRAPARRGGIVALRFPGDAQVARTLVDTGFICSYRGGLRVAPHFYNTDAEIDRFMRELARLATSVAS